MYVCMRSRTSVKLLKEEKLRKEESTQLTPKKKTFAPPFLILSLVYARRTGNIEAILYVRN